MMLLLNAVDMLQYLSSAYFRLIEDIPSTSMIPLSACFPLKFLTPFITPLIYSFSPVYTLLHRISSAALFSFPIPKFFFSSFPPQGQILLPSSILFVQLPTDMKLPTKSNKLEMEFSSPHIFASPLYFR